MQKKARQDKERSVNRKLLVWLFVLTGILSLFFWWRGKVIHGSMALPGPGGGDDLTFVIKPTGSGRTGGLSSEDTSRFEEEITQLTASASGTYAVYVYRLGENTGYGVNGEMEMPGASIMKLPVFITAITKIEDGELKYTDTYTLEEADRAPGSGPLQFKQAGTNYSIDQLLTLLGQNSDNTAWVMFNRRFGKDVIAENMDIMDLSGSNYGNLTTTARDVAVMWNFMYKGPISPGDRKKLWGYLTNSIYEDRIPAGLSGTGAEIIGHKVGTDTDVWADSGIISGGKHGPFVLVVLNQGVERAEATDLVPKLVKAVWDFENSTG